MPKAPPHLTLSRLLRRLASVSILGTAALGLLYFLTYFLINSGFAGRLFDASVNELFRGRVAWERVSWGPQPWRLRVLRPTVFGAAGEVIITAEELRASIDLVALAMGRIWADDIDVRGPSVHIAVRPAISEFDGPYSWVNIADAFFPVVEKPDDGQPSVVPHLRFSGIRIQRGQVKVEVDPVWVRGADIRVEDGFFELRPDLEIHIGAKQAAVAQIEVEISLDDPEQPAAEGAGAAPLRWVAHEVMATGFRWRGMQFGVHHVTAQIPPADAVDVRGFGMDLDRPGIPFIKGRVTARVKDLATQLAQFGIGDLHGPVEATLDGEGEIDSFVGTLTAEGGRLAAYGFETGPWRLSARGVENRYSIDSLAVSAYGGSLKTRVTFAGEAGGLAAELDLDKINPAALPVALPEPVRQLLAGRLSGRIELGSPDLYDPSPALSTGLSLRLERTERSPFVPTRPVHLRGAVHLTDGRLDLSTIQIETAPDRLVTSGVIDLKALTTDPDRPTEGIPDSIGLDGSLQVAALGPHLERFGVPLVGTAEARFRLRGDVRQPRIHVALTGRSLKLAGHALGRVSAELDYPRPGGGPLFVRSAALSGPAGSIDVRGKVGLHRPGLPLGLTVRARDLQLSALPSPEPISGNLNATAKVTGPAASPRVTATAGVERPRWRALELNKLDVRGAYRGTQIDLDHLEVRDDDRVLAQAQGHLDWGLGTFDGRVRLQEIAAETIQPLLPEPLPIRGSLTADLAGGGALTRPSGQGHIVLSGVGYDKYELGTAELTVSAEANMIDLRGRLFDLCTLEAAVPLERTGPPAQATVEFTQVHLEERLPELAEMGLSTSFGGRITATGRMHEPSQVDVTAELDEVSVTSELIQIEAPQPLRLSYRHGVLALDAVAIKVSGQPLELTGTVGSEGDLDLGLTGTMDLAVIAPFVVGQFTVLQGVVELNNLALTGPLSDPMPSGSVRLINAYMTPRSSTIGREIQIQNGVELAIGSIEGPRQKPGEFNVSMPRFRTDGSGTRNTLEVRRDDGLITVDRIEVFFSEFKPEALIVWADADNISLRVPDMIRATLDADQVVFEIWDLMRPHQIAMRIAGHVHLLRGIYTGDIYGSSEISQDLRQNLSGVSRATTVSVFERAPILKRLWLDLTVEGESDLFLRNQVTVLTTDVELRPSLSLKGLLHDASATRPEDRLQIAGEISALPDSSSITYAGRKFEVRVCEVVLGGSSFMDGSLTAQATFDVRHDTDSNLSDALAAAGGDTRTEEVTLAVTFRMATRHSPLEYTWELQSDSGASDIEVLTLVLTGKYPSDLSGAASAQPALEVALGPLLNLIERPLEDTLDVQLDVTPQSTGTVEVDVDKRLFERLRLFSRASVSGEEVGNSLTLGAEYQLNNVTFGELSNTRVGLENNTTARVRWRMLLD